ncbi:potassium-transporting ATPase subunit KdpA [Ktedonospora formicarum]|uniref:Potassium-transporting ATPase potassium-binding subunit n=1 Tax=Ktedonospora formicarum TaxID=2778364 RepID=A0A8J3I7X9_9CHLR|nr:potassium-transporting ATPase subunit KdpA [Ktedonospora formicarum]GHO48788.1 potassium-transporting ATPase potassium-binding subunit [Ktedonospora formicarum]
MSVFACIQYGVFLCIVALLVKPMGIYLKRVFAREHTWLDPLFCPIERTVYRVVRIDAEREMNWKQYSLAFILFTLIGTLALYVLLRVQHLLPWFDAAHMSTPMTPDLAFNTAISFSTTTTWQAYAGETTMSYFTQIVGLATQNFLAGAAGLAVGIAFIRGIARERTESLGNFWRDLVRALLWVLLPISLIGSVLLIWQGVPMNFHPYTEVRTLEGGTQIIAQGPVAALEWIKNLGTNGGGFFNVNGAHPFENPTPFTNILEMLAIVVLPASLTYTFGLMVGNTRQGWVLFWVMTTLFIAGLLLCGWAEQHGNPALSPYMTSEGGNMEGKEVRFGIGGSVLTAITTSNGATGSYNSMHDSYTPLGGAIPLLNMLLGEIIYGGLGTGVYSIIMVALIGLFLAGLMIGRTPEYLGKKIEPPEMKLLALYTLIGSVSVVTSTALAIVIQPGLAGLTTNGGPHGLTEILYAFASSMANNGQNFAGLSANSPFYNVATGLVMLLGRFGLAIPALALAGKLSRQSRRPMTPGKLQTDSVLFGTVIIFTALIVVGLTYVAVLALGPVVEQFRMG